MFSLVTNYLCQGVGVSSWSVACLSVCLSTVVHEILGRDNTSWAENNGLYFRMV